MATKSLYSIEFYGDISKAWIPVTGFSCMQKSYAMGAWAMLRAYYEHSHRYRLLRDGKVIKAREVKWVPNPDYDKATGEVVLYGPDFPVGPCRECGLPTNRFVTKTFVCSFCSKL